MFVIVAFICTGLYAPTCSPVTISTVYVDIQECREALDTLGEQVRAGNLSMRGMCTKVEIPETPGKAT